MNRQASNETIPSSAQSVLRKRLFLQRSLAIGSRGCWRVFPIVCLIAVLTSVAWADARFSLEGQLSLGTDQMYIPFNLSAQTEIIYSPLGFRTWSYSGGTNSAGEVIPAGGFDPTLALLNNADTQIAYADDGSGIASNFDSLLNFYVGTPAIPSPLAAGNYTLRLEPLNDTFGTKTKNWAVDLNGPDNVLSLALPIIDLLPENAGISKVAVTGPGSKWTNSVGLIVGLSGQGTLQVADGGMVSNTTGAIVGVSPDSNGAVTVTGTSSLWNNSGYINIGYAGTGQLTVGGGGRVNNTIGDLGTDIGSTGAATVTGAGSTWDNSDILNVGNTGSGTLLVEGGGMVSNTVAYIGFAGSSRGTATVTGAGSTWANSGGLYVGYSGTGTLRVADGAVVSNSFAFINLLGSSASTATVTGPGSKWTNSGELYVGNSGTGTLLVEAGGMVSNTTGSIGFNGGSAGAATVTGLGSNWTNSSNLYVGGGSVDPGGSGELSVKDNGLVEVTGTLKIWSTGTVTLGGGSLFVGSIDAESLARIHLKAGSFIVTSGNLSVGIPGQSSQTIFPRDLNVNVFNLATVPADGTLAVFGGFSSGGLTNLGTTLFVNTAIRGPVNNPTGSAINVVGNVVFTGLVSGGGSIFGSGTADFRGGVSPGASPARVNIEGSASFATSNTLFVELGGLAAGAEFDVLEIGGQADLGGTLDVSLLGGFTPSAGDRFDFLTAALVQGTFDTKLLPSLAGGLQWLVDYRTDGVSLLVSSASLAGDYNNDGTVNLADYTMWRDQLGAPAGTLLNDPAGGVIGTAQYAQWKTHFGQTIGGSGAISLTAVPEPATVVVLALLVLGMLAIRLPRRAAWSLAYCGALAGSFVLTGPVQAAILIDSMSVGATDVSPFFSAPVPDPLVVAGSLTVGQTTSGALEINGGSNATSESGSIGLNLGSTGVATVTGAGSIWLNLQGNLSVGETGNGTLNVLAGGRAQNAIGTIGRNLGSIGVVTVTGNDGGVNDSIWINSGSLFVGYSGNGTLNGTPSGIVTSPTGFIGFNPGSTGVVTLTGSRWTNSGDLSVGESGNGTLNVQTGSLVTNASGTIGRNLGSTGVATVTGADARWNSAADLTVGNSGNGTLNVLAGGFVSNINGTLGFNQGTTGLVTVTGADSRWTNTGTLYVGRGGNGTLNITTGGAVSNTTGFIGLNLGSTGVATVTGTGSSWTNTGGLTVGQVGKGTLNVAAGGLVSNTIGTIGFSGSTGAVTVTDANSRWTNTGNLFVGRGNGNGTLNVAAGGFVSNTAGLIGTDPGSIGVATVTGAGSTWNNISGLNVGNSGNGTLNVTAGGGVSSASGSIGGGAGSTGVATVTGANSIWTNTANLAVGNGTLNVMGGGLVSNTIGNIGYFAGSTGVVTVTGANSRWTNTGNLFVGANDFPGIGPGNGTLNILDSGEVGAGGALAIGAAGRVTLDGGTLSVASLSIVSGGRLRLDGGTFNLTSANLGVGAAHPMGKTLNIQSGVAVNVTNASTVETDGTLAVFGQFTSGGGLTNRGDLLLIDTTGLGRTFGNTLNSTAGSAVTLVGDTTFTAAVSGAGNFFGPGGATFAGGYSPGDSPAEVSFAGDVTLADTNTLFIEIGGPTLGTNYDSLMIDGVAQLDGLLSVSLGGFTPAVGQQFTVLTASSIMDNGLLLSGPAANSFNLIVGATSVILEAVAAGGLTGDYNGSGVVDPADYTVWRDNLGQFVTLPNDSTPGTVTQADYDTWRAHFGQTLGSGSGASANVAVPEPAALVLLMFAAAGWCLRRVQSA